MDPGDMGGILGIAVDGNLPRPTKVERRGKAQTPNGESSLAGSLAEGVLDHLVGGTLLF